MFDLKFHLGLRNRNLSLNLPQLQENVSINLYANCLPSYFQLFIVKVRIGRPLSAGTYRLQGGTVEAITPTKTKFHRQPSGQSDIECDGKVSMIV